MDIKELVQTSEFKNEALGMLHDIQTNSLIVKLSGIIDTTGRKLRLVESRNPEWYRELFNTYWNGVKNKGCRRVIRRYLVINALSNLSEGFNKKRSTYNILMAVIEDRLYNGYYIPEECFFVPPALVREE